MLLLVLIVPSVFAADKDVGSVNYYAPMIDDESYAALLKHIFDGGDADGALLLYDELENYMRSSEYDAWMQDAALQT